MENFFLHTPLGIALGLLLVLLIFTILVCDENDDFVDFLIKVTANPVGYIVNFFCSILKLVSIALQLGVVALLIYLLVEYTWWIVSFIATIILVIIVISCICSHRDYHKEMRIYNRVSSFLQKGNYESAEYILSQEAKDKGDKEVGELYSSLLKLIQTLKEKEGKRKPKVWNIYIYDPIQPNRALVPMSHYQSETTELKD